MTFTQLIFRNMIRNYSLYLAYFFSCVLSVLSFFVYTIFIFHPQLSNRVVLQNAVDWMYGASSLIYIFAIGFILYSIRIFLQNRQQEFDIWFTQGMSIKQFRMMIFYENVYIGIGSIAIGIICGISIEKTISSHQLKYNGHFTTSVLLSGEGNCVYHRRIYIAVCDFSIWNAFFDKTQKISF